MINSSQLNTCLFKLKQYYNELVAYNNHKSNKLQDMNDTIKHLKAEIQILNEKLTGIQNVANAKDEAIRNITEAKKNINVTVNSKK